MLRLKEVETLATKVQALWERECILYWQSHIGYTKLGFHTAILELNGTVYYRLWMNQHLNLLGVNTEQPLCLDNLEALVHHRC